MSLQDSMDKTENLLKSLKSVDFFCHACLVDKPASEASPDPRYCQGCYDVLIREAESLPLLQCPKWIPKQQIDEMTGEKAIPVPQDVVLIMSTLNGKKSEVDIIHSPVGKVTHGKRGPKKNALPRELIKQWAGEGMGSKSIATRLKGELGIKISYKTIQRLLSSESGLPNETRVV